MKAFGNRKWETRKFPPGNCSFPGNFPGFDQNWLKYGKNWPQSRFWGKLKIVYHLKSFFHLKKITIGPNWTLLRILANCIKNFEILVTVRNFPGFLVFPDQEIGHFSRFPTGNWNTRKCATLVWKFHDFCII